MEMIFDKVQFIKKVLNDSRSQLDMHRRFAISVIRDADNKHLPIKKILVRRLCVMPPHIRNGDVSYRSVPYTPDDLEFPLTTSKPEFESKIVLFKCGADAKHASVNRTWLKYIKARGIYDLELETCCGASPWTAHEIMPACSNVSRLSVKLLSANRSQVAALQSHLKFLHVSGVLYLSGSTADDPPLRESSAHIRVINCLREPNKKGVVEKILGGFNESNDDDDDEQKDRRPRKLSIDQIHCTVAQFDGCRVKPITTVINLFPAQVRNRDQDPDESNRVGFLRTETVVSSTNDIYMVYTLLFASPNKDEFAYPGFDFCNMVFQTSKLGVLNTFLKNIKRIRATSMMFDFANRNVGDLVTSMATACINSNWRNSSVLTISITYGTANGTHMYQCDRREFKENGRLPPKKLIQISTVGRNTLKSVRDAPSVLGVIPHPSELLKKLQRTQFIPSYAESTSLELPPQIPATNVIVTDYYSAKPWIESKKSLFVYIGPGSDEPLLEKTEFCNPFE